MDADPLAVLVGPPGPGGLRMVLQLQLAEPCRRSRGLKPVARPRPAPQHACILHPARLLGHMLHHEGPHESLALLVAGVVVRPHTIYHRANHRHAVDGWFNGFLGQPALPALPACLLACGRRWLCRLTQLPPATEREALALSPQPQAAPHAPVVLPDTVTCDARPAHMAAIFPKHAWNAKVAAVNASAVLQRERELYAYDAAHARKKLRMNITRSAASRSMQVRCGGPCLLCSAG